MRPMSLPLVFVLGCAAHAHVPDTGALAQPDVCDGVPSARTTSFRHEDHWVLAQIGETRHRGVDLVALETDDTQRLGGKLAYTAADENLKDEDAEVFACTEGDWRSLGEVRTDKHGRFELELAGDARLPVGMRDLYAHVRGDGSGVRFLAVVAPVGTSVLVSDVDGTLTSSENAVVGTVLTGDDAGHQPRAPEVFTQTDQLVVYVTARGDQFTNLTRHWLLQHGFPLGPLRLAPSIAILPGSATVDFKTKTLVDLAIPISAGIGNRGSDIDAYTNVGLAPDRILILDGEFTDEVRGAIADEHATGFANYEELAALL